MQPTVRAIKGERFLQIRATRDAFSALETQIGCPVATAVRGQNSFHCRHNPNGSETRLFSIPSGGIVGLDLLHGEIVPGVHASIAPADLSHFRAAGASGAKPVQVQPQLIAALTKAVDR